MDNDSLNFDDDREWVQYWIEFEEWWLNYLEAWNKRPWAKENKMKREIGNMFDTIGAIVGGNHMLLATGNSFIRQDGCLVMGRGAARQLALRYPHIPRLFGRRITHLSKYLIVTEPSHQYAHPWLGVLQVKYHFKDMADMDLLSESISALKMTANTLPHFRIDINYPGIGNGCISAASDLKQIVHLLNSLPDNVHVWTFH